MMHWPQLDYAADRPVIEACHMVLQLVGKLPTRLHPWENHGWHVTFRVSPRGFVTRMMPTGGARHFSVEIDMLDAELAIRCDDGGIWRLPFATKPIATLQTELRELLVGQGLPATLHGGPNELPEVKAFSEDREPRPWDTDIARRMHGAFACVDRNFAVFRSQYLGKGSPSHLFWGSFDLAVTRFSGREAPRHPGGFPNLPDRVTREAYSHEVISAGFWLGGGGVEEAAFYAYAYPSPDGLDRQDIRPAEAGWNAALGEFVLPYAAVAAAKDPDRKLQDFLQSTFDASARLLDWPSGLAHSKPSYGQPAA